MKQTCGKDGCLRSRVKKATAGEYIFRFHIYNLKHHSLYHTRNYIWVREGKSWQNNHKRRIKYD